MTSGDITVNPFGQLFFFTSPTPTFGNNSQTITLNGIGTQLADFSAGNSGALRFDASGTNSVAFQGNLNIGNLVGGATISIGGNDTLAVNGSVAFNGTLQKQGSGTLVLNGTGSGSGGTSVGNGTLTIASAAALGSGAISVASGATLHVTGSLDLAGSQLITNNGTITGVVNANSGSTAKGSGAYGSLAINSGGTISPGNSPGLMAMSDLAINGGNYLWELGALSTWNPGTDFDQVQVNSGNATLTGGTVTLDFSILGNNAPTAQTPIRSGMPCINGRSLR